MRDSMTAFGRAIAQGPWGSAVWEIRSVNHRYQELHFKLPEPFRFLEPDLRNLVQAKIARGKLDISLTYVAGDAGSAGLQLNMHLARQLWALQTTIVENFGLSTPLHTVDIMRWPGVVITSECDVPSFAQDILDAFETALVAVSEMRRREGSRLQSGFLLRLEELSMGLQQLRAGMPGWVIAQEAKVHAQIARLGLADDRYAAEVVLLVQRSDVTEELDRLEAHIAEIQETLSAPGCVGRRLDFLMQELHREANTLSAKAVNQGVTQIAVTLKVVIEQLREQIQNVE